MDTTAIAALEANLQHFVAYCQQLRGDEKGEAQVFLDRLFQALGYADGVKGAGATLEERIRDGTGRIHFADCVLPGRALLEMKRRGERLELHHSQALSYQSRLKPPPRYIVLCNFDEFLVYDTHSAIYDPVDRLPLLRLPESWGALAFLLPEPQEPIFNKEFDYIDITKQAATRLSAVYSGLEKRLNKVLPTEQLQRFILQCMMALFSESIGLLPRYLFTRLIEDCLHKGGDSYELFMMLFALMDNPQKMPGGRFGEVAYFNGGLFAHLHPITLTPNELENLREAANHNWSRIRPSIFGRIFEASLNPNERHRSGAHYTTEADIMRIIDPVLVQPWEERLAAAQDEDSLRALHKALCAYRILDPACGSGNFLYVAYKALKGIEQRLLRRLQADYGLHPQQIIARVSVRQFYGLDTNAFAVELARVTLMIAKKLAVDELGSDENPLPLDTLDDNIKVADALFAPWPPADLIIGNPPYLGSRKMKAELGVEYVNQVRAAYPAVPGNADYCVYWFRKAHDHLPEGGRAGLVGTNSIAQNYSRIGGLDYIVQQGGQIFAAYPSIVWREGQPEGEQDSDQAAVSVAIACWSKGPAPHAPLLYTRHPTTGALEAQPVGRISSSLSGQIDVSDAAVLACNKKPKRVFQGQITGHHGFVLSAEEARALVKRDMFSRQVIHPFLIGRDFVSQPLGQATQYVIDMNGYDAVSATQFREAYKRLEQQVLPAVEDKAKREAKRNQQAKTADVEAPVDRDAQRTLDQWWKLHRGREDMLKHLATLPRYIALSRVTKRPIFDFVAAAVHPDHSLFVFGFADDYSFGVLQSRYHWAWFTAKASTLTDRYRYTPNSVYDTFPFPQAPSVAAIEQVAAAGRALHEWRRATMQQLGKSLRELYRTTEKPGKNPLKDLHAALDAAVAAAYGFASTADPLEGLYALNQQVAARLAAKQPVTAPGLPADVGDPARFISAGCIAAPSWE